MRGIKHRTWAAAIAVVFMICFLMPVVSLACNIEYEAPQGSGTRYMSFETGETSRTITAAAEVVSYELYNYCSYTKSIGSCTGGCCLGMCGPISLKVCTDGFFYSAFCPSGQSCNYSSAPPIPWDVVCECLQDSDCDDGVFCNGTETCADTACVAGSSPCSEAQVCDEDNDQCVECLEQGHCPEGYRCVNGTCQCDFLYSVSNGNVIIWGYTGPGGDAVIPSSIDGMPVTEIGGAMIPIEGAFAGLDSLTSVTIPGSITRIGAYAFFDCNNLRSVMLGDGVSIIEKGAFMNCWGLTSISIPASVTRIDGDFDRRMGLYLGAFSYCYSLSVANFEGNAPTTMSPYAFKDCDADFRVCYKSGATGFTTPTWFGYPAEECYFCIDASDCPEGYSCVDGECEPIPDDPPALTAGPYLAAGTWPLLPTSQESPVYLDANYNVLWKFSDDFASCSGDCTHSAEYQAIGGNSWTAIDVTANAAKGFAYVTLPVESLQNATTYAFRYSVTDCASQTTQSQTYYFRVAITDAPPVIKSGPFLATGDWWTLPTSASSAIVLDQNEYVLWTFSDDYAGCAGLCTHRARYRNVVDTAWTWITPVSTDPTGKKYAYTEQPVSSLPAGTYQFFFDVLDCNGQRTYATTFYYFKVE